MGLVIFGSSSTVYLLSSGKMKTGAIMMKKTRKTMETPAPQIHHVLGSRRTMPKSAMQTTPPSTTFTRSTMSWSPSQGPSVCVANPYCRSRK